MTAIRFAHYEDVEPLIQDRRRSIYRALRRSDHAPVIIKTTTSDRPRRIDTDRLKHEFTILEHLAESPHSPRALALDHEDGRPLLVMEDVGAQVLKSFITDDRDSIQTVEQALLYGAHIATALADVHERQVIHKDIKPGNILIDQSTKATTLIDFGISTRMPVQYREAQPPTLLEGTLAYMSPEQTGRMNRGIDYRSDLYSFGVTLFQMLTGQLPFAAADPLEWCHCHLARTPRSAGEFRPELPETVIQILDKLLNKVPEKRYQSARGCAIDLRRCLDQVRESGAVEPFALAESDVALGFHISAKLYGRDREIADISTKFEHTATDGRCRLVLIAGYSGIGKSSLVKELYKPVSAARGRLLTGKFEQYKRDRPYDTIIQVLQNLIRQLLVEGEDTIASWRARIAEAVGINGGVITALIPELEHIIGPQPPVFQVGPRESQNRFDMVFRGVIRAIATVESPIAVFLDDMQWTDTATLRLLRAVVNDPTIRHICFILAYRDNEVGESHPFTRFMDEIAADSPDADRAVDALPVLRISLSPLSTGSLRALLGDTLHAPQDSDEVSALAELLIAKTAGNPFFVIQFLTRLYEDGLLTWRDDARCFGCDLDAVATRDFSDNVVEHMVQRLRLLDADTLIMLELASCIGDDFRVADLCLATGISAGQIVDQSWPAVTAGLLLPVGKAYDLAFVDGADDDEVQGVALRFPHDRIRQAAYSLLDDDRRKQTHLRLGRGWRAQVDDASLDDRVFAITAQLNPSRGLIEDAEERLDLASLNLRAGRKAKASTAYRTAVEHLEIAAALLGEGDRWQRHYQLAFDVTLALAESLFLSGEHDHSDVLFQEVINNARTPVEKGSVYGLRIQMYHVFGDFEGALELGIKGLACLGVEVPDGPDNAERLDRETAEAIAAAVTHLGDRSIHELVDAPLLADPALTTIIQLSMQSVPSAFAARPSLIGWFDMHAVNISLQHGHAALSDLAYSFYGMLLCTLLGEPKTGKQFSDVSVALNAHLENKAVRGAILHVHAHFVCFWNAPVTTAIHHADDSFSACEEAGDMAYMGFAAMLSLWLRLERGDAMSALDEARDKFASIARHSNSETIYHTLELQDRYLACLQGTAESLTDMNGDGFDEREYVAAMQQASLGPAVTYYHIIKQILHYHAGQYAASLACADDAQPLLGTITGMPIEASYYLFRALASCALYDAAAPEQRAAYDAVIEAVRDKWHVWGDSCPDTFAGRRDLLDAEIARIHGDLFTATRLYEAAVRHARTYNFLHHEGLASVIAARFCTAHELNTSARAYVRAAVNCYERWGALGLVEQIFEDYPRARLSKAAGDSTSTITASASSSSSVAVSSLDAFTALKASQALSSELKLANLVQGLLTITMEHAGADYGRLLLMGASGDITVYADDGRPYPFADAPGIARSAVVVVQRTGEPVLLHDAQASPEYGSDPHIADTGVRSLLCLPIVHQGKLQAMLYLENRHLGAVFTEARMSMLSVLSLQAAISIENASLYLRLEEHNRTLEDRVARRTAELREATQEAQRANQAKSQFLAHVSHEVRTPLTGIISATSLLEASKLDADQMRLAHIVHRSSENMLGILNDLLDLSKIEAGKMELSVHPFELRACIQDIIELLTSLCDSKGIALACEIADDVPDAVVGDAMRIRQVLLNLLNNAIKFTDEGSVALDVARRGSDHLRFTVRDTGSGIPEDRVSAIFGAFTQASTTTARKHGGSGLGLAICEQLVVLMGGRIWVESELGKGSTFYVELELKPAEAGAAAAPDASDADVDSPLLEPVSTATPLRILLVEDNVINQKLVRRMLTKLGHERVLLAENGQQAVEAITDQAYDVILMDMRMPVMNGIEATRAIRSNADIAVQPRIVAMTASSMSNEIEACIKSGMDDYLCKPFTLVALQAALARAAARSS